MNNDTPKYNNRIGGCRRQLLLIIVAGSLLALDVFGCQSPPAAPKPTATVAAPPSGARQPWQDDWDKTLAAAKLEGKVVAISAFGGEGATTLAKAFNTKYGLDIEFVIGRGPENFVKINNERRAGLYLEDVYLAGLNSIVLVKDGGFLDPLKPLLVLPEVVDSRAWLYGELPFQEKEGLILRYIGKAVAPVLINTDLVKSDEINSYADLLSPKYKGKIVVMDPTIGAAGTVFFLVLWKIMGPDFTREMAKQDLAITGDARQAAEWLARGKYPISGTISDAALTEMVKAGAPLKIVIPKEGTIITSSTGAVAYMNRAPHPNAAKVLVNWLLTREGQTLMSRIFGAPSRRVDISYDWVDPAALINPALKYVNQDDDEVIKLTLELQNVSRDVWNVKK